MDRLPRRNQRSSTNRISSSDPPTNGGGLQTPLRYLQGIGPKRADQLAGIGLLTVEDLLYHLPFRYEDRRRINKIAAALQFLPALLLALLVVLASPTGRHVRELLGVIRRAQAAERTGPIADRWERASR